jgi:hypothetical protein
MPILKMDKTWDTGRGMGDGKSERNDLSVTYMSLVSCLTSHEKRKVKGEKRRVKSGTGDWRRETRDARRGTGDGKVGRETRDMGEGLRRLVNP